MNAYFRYISQRFIILAATIFISMTVVFVVPRLVPGDPLGAVFANMAAVGGSVNAPELVAEYRERFGLDRPMWDQYVSFWRELLRGNLGYSISNFPGEVSDMLMSALPWTIGLLTLTTLLSWVTGSVIGAIVGWRGRKAGGWRALVPVALVLYTTPYYILALILVFVFAFLWPIFPLSGAYSVSMRPGWNMAFVLDVLHHATLPALSILLVSLGWWFLSMRSLIIQLKGEDYILNAEAMGIGERRILWGYAFRNALLPQATGLAISLGHIVGGALITEVIFAYPGIGYRIYNAINSLDYPLIQGGVLLIIISVAVANFLIDILYPIIDPRIRFEGAQGS
ncbi:MAG: ABC transporter permease [Caldilineaceae bacterium]|nr:ABC transporter permease [Caldilineaceae bacterium]